MAWDVLQLCDLPAQGMGTTGIPKPPRHRKARNGLSALQDTLRYRITESSRLEKTSKITKCNHQGTTTIISKVNRVTKCHSHAFSEHP